MITISIRQTLSILPRQFVNETDQARESVDEIHALRLQISEGGYCVRVEARPRAYVRDRHKHGGGALSVDELDAGQEGGEELVHDPSLETVPEVSGELVVDRDAVAVGFKSCFLNCPQIFHVTDPD